MPESGSLQTLTRQKEGPCYGPWLNLLYECMGRVGARKTCSGMISEHFPLDCRLVCSKVAFLGYNWSMESVHRSGKLPLTAGQWTGGQHDECQHVTQSLLFKHLWLILWESTLVKWAGKNLAQFRGGSCGNPCRGLAPAQIFLQGIPWTQEPVTDYMGLQSHDWVTNTRTQVLLRGSQNWEHSNNREPDCLLPDLSQGPIFMFSGTGQIEGYPSE